jgi:Ca2+-binding EF-hand superfamily protein
MDVQVFSTFDDSRSGLVSKKDFLAACAALGVVPSEKEADYLFATTPCSETGLLAYREFCSAYATAASS